MTLTLPKFEMYEEGGQRRRSSKAVSSDIVEGFCRKRYLQEYIRYLIFAHGSCNETIEHLELLYQIGSLKDKELFQSLKNSYEQLGGKLNRLIEIVSKGIRETHST